MTQRAVSTFHCATASGNKLEDELGHLCHYGHTLVLVMGPPGSGRTHVAERLALSVSRSLPVALVAAAPLMSDEQLDADILTQLGLHQLAIAGADLDAAVARAPLGRRVLIIDDTQDLHSAILRRLLQLALHELRRDEPRLVLILFGDDVLEAALAEINFGGLDAKQLQRLSPALLTEDDAQRMAPLWAAANQRAVPDKANVRLSWQLSHGHPGPFLESLAMHNDANEEQQDSMGEDESLRADRGNYGAEETSSGGLAWLKTPLLVLGVLLLASLLLYQGEINEWISGSAPVTAQATSTIAPTTASGSNEVAKPTAAVSTDTDGRTALPIDAEPVSGNTAPTLATESTASPASNAAATSSSSLNTPAPTVVPTVVPAVNTPASTTTPAKLAVMAEKTPAIAPSVAVTPIKTPVKVASAEPVKEKVTPPKDSKPTSASSDFSSDEQHLLAANGKHFAVQIVGLSELKAMRDYMAQHKLASAHIYRGLRGGKQWYVLVMTEYSDHAAAEAARDALPEAIRSQGPWIKQLSVIQDEIKAAAKAR